jgi:hypothetical protein
MLHIIDRTGHFVLAPEQTNLEAPETVSSSQKTLSGTPNFSPIIACYTKPINNHHSVYI